MSRWNERVKEVEDSYDEVLRPSTFTDTEALFFKSIGSPLKSKTVIIHGELFTLYSFSEVSIQKKKYTLSMWVTLILSEIVLIGTSIFWDFWKELPLLLYSFLFRRRYLVITSLHGTYYISCTQRQAKRLREELEAHIEGI